MKRLEKAIAIIIAIIVIGTFLPSEAVMASEGVEAMLCVQNQTAKAGEKVSVDILIKNNPGIAGATIQIEYDQALTLQNVINGGALSELTFTKPAEYANPSRFLWDSESGMSQKDGVLLTLQFLVSEEAVSGEELSIQISYMPGDIFNEQLQDVSLQLNSGVITVITETETETEAKTEKETETETGTAEDCEKDGHKYGKILQKIEGSDDIPSKTECLKQGSYKVAFFCERCGAYDPDSVQTVYTEAKGHKPCEEAQVENEILPTHQKGGSYDLVIRCKNCDEIINSASVKTDKTAHTPGKAVKENETAATHDENGSYDLVVYCTEETCNAELSREKITTEKIPHTLGEPVKENETEATCSVNGSYDLVIYCTEETCKAELSRKHIITAKTEHTPGAAVKENVVKENHKTGGSYDLVIYCEKEDCKAELMREHVITEKEMHTQGEPVKENVIEPSCTEKGSYDLVVYCTEEDCKEELVRELITVDKTMHVPGEAVKENEKKATCTAGGSYNNVIYCVVCGKKVSSTQVRTPKEQHQYVIDKEVAATENATGLTEGAHCSACKTILVKQKEIPKLVLENAEITIGKHKATYKVSKIKKKKQTFRIGAKVAGDGRITYKKISGSSKLTVSKSGKVTVKKGTKKGTYRMNVLISVGETAEYEATDMMITVLVKIKK